VGSVSLAHDLTTPHRHKMRTHSCTSTWCQHHTTACMLPGVDLHVHSRHWAIMQSVPSLPSLGQNAVSPITGPSCSQSHHSHHWAIMQSVPSLPSLGQNAVGPITGPSCSQSHHSHHWAIMQSVPSLPSLGHHAVSPITPIHAYTHFLEFACMHTPHHMDIMNMKSPPLDPIHAHASTNDSLTCSLPSTSLLATLCWSDSPST
jgi:hypothetical protein